MIFPHYESHLPKANYKKFTLSDSLIGRHDTYHRVCHTHPESQTRKTASGEHNSRVIWLFLSALADIGGSAEALSRGSADVLEPR